MKLSFSPLNYLAHFLQVTTVTALVLNYPAISLAKTHQEISPNTVVTSVQFVPLAGVVSKANIDARKLTQTNASEEKPPVPEAPGGKRG